MPAKLAQLRGLPTQLRAKLPYLGGQSGLLAMHTLQVVNSLVARYRSVPQLLVKVEELVAGTATGKSPALTG